MRPLTDCVISLLLAVIRMHAEWKVNKILLQLLASCTRAEYARYERILYMCMHCVNVMYNTIEASHAVV